MSKKIQSGVVCALLAGKHLIFQNEDIIQDIYGLGPQLFKGPGPDRHLNENQLKSLREMMSAVEKAKDIKTRYNILEGKQQTSYGAGRDALTIWFKKQQISSTISTKVDAVWKDLDLLPLQLIHLDPEAGFPNVADADMAREDIAVALFGANSVASPYRGMYCLPDHTIYPAVIENADTVTPQMLREATHHVKMYSQSIKWFPLEVEKLQGVSELEEFLKTVVVTAVAKAKGVAKEKLAPEISDPKEPPGSAKSRGRTRASKVKNVSLSAAGDVDLIWPAYVQLYRTTPTEPDAPAVDLEGEDRDAMWEGSNDLGVDNFRSLDDTALNRLLNFPDGRPALFARFRSLSRKSAWDDGAEKDFVEGNPDMQPLSLLWHQRVGIASIVEKIWQKDITNTVPGILLADEVGVGKTAQVMGSIAFMIDQYWAHQIASAKAVSPLIDVDVNTVRKAPILESIPYFAGQAQVPDLPHVIAVPNSLVAQWMSELRIFFVPKTVEIYVYPTAEKDFAAFWTGPWEKSSMPKINRIILVTHSGKVLDTRKGKVGHNQNKAVDDKRTVKSPHLERNCIWYNRVFASCTLDEAHEFRNPNAGWHAMLLLMRNSHVRIIATATPLFTSPKDLCNIGRVLRIPHFTGTEGDDFENNHWKALGAARRVITKEDKELAAKHTIQRLAGSKAEYNEPASKTRVRQLTTVWIKQIKRRFSNRVIRRTVESLRFDGKRINDSLPPYLMVFFPVHLTDPELDIVETGMDSLAGNFYMEARTKVPLPFHNSPNYPPVADWDEYNEVRSTKDLDKELTEEEQKKLDDEYDKDTDPDFIGDYAHRQGAPGTHEHGYQEDSGVHGIHHDGTFVALGESFAMLMNDTLGLTILKMHDIEALSLNGTLTADERNETIRRFNTVPEDRVLLFSTVGAVGLNLTVATIVVLF
ncbi:hypothetical protein C8R48DRAFT_677411, partial [Suillus tomentosus]